MSSLGGKKRKFPELQDLGSAVYNENTIYRDNSYFVTELVKKGNVLFTRPPQLGKTTLLSLAELLLSKTENSPDGLKHYPTESDKNQWYVIYISFGGIEYSGGEVNTLSNWENHAREVDRAVNRKIRRTINTRFLELHEEIKQLFNEYLGTGLNDNSVDIGEIVDSLASAVVTRHRQLRQTDNALPERPTLLFLVDEYDAPIRDLMFDFVGEKIEDVSKKMKKAFHNYCRFFNSCKHSADNKITIKTWVTGITPVGLSSISNFQYHDMSYDEELADAVGWLREDVESMLEDAIAANRDSFGKSELEESVKRLGFYFNNLQFPHGSPLYHTGMVNAAMSKLESAKWRGWLKDLPKLTKYAEEVPSRAFDVVARASSSIRGLVKQLVDKKTLIHDICGPKELSIAQLLHDGKLTSKHYLTLLVHLGIVSASNNAQKQMVFKSTSEIYRKKHLAALDHALAHSIGELLQLKSKKEMYSKRGTAILNDFLVSLSERRMKELIAWANSGEGKILELQLQGNIVESLYTELRDAGVDAHTAQEQSLPSGRSDITITTSRCIVVLELKKKEGPNAPSTTQWAGYHDQLRGYVEDYRRKAQPPVWVAGFVLVMYNVGKSYAVQELSNDDA